MSPKSKEFIALKKKWYAKLEKAGFDDIEQDEEHLKKWDGHFFAKRCRSPAAGPQEEYYRLAGQFLHDHLFTSVFERLVWQMHCDGVSVEAMVRALKDSKRKFNKNTLHKIIKSLADMMLRANLNG